jgi:hypothetical protein
MQRRNVEKHLLFEHRVRSYRDRCGSAPSGAALFAELRDHRVAEVRNYCSVGVTVLSRPGFRSVTRVIPFAKHAAEKR